MREFKIEYDNLCTIYYQIEIDIIYCEYNDQYYL